MSLARSYHVSVRGKVKAGGAVFIVSPMNGTAVWSAPYRDGEHRTIRCDRTTNPSYLRLNGPSTNAERPTLDESRSSLCPLHSALPSPHPRPGGSGGEHGD